MTVGGTVGGAARRVGGSAAEGWRRTAGWLSRAVGSSGHERHTLLLVGKSALAAWISWLIAHHVLAAQSPAFAPFSAVWMIRVTVYQSIAHALRYVTAVVAGVALSGALGFTPGPVLLLFAVVAVLSLSLAQLPRLGVQGTQVATAAFFAYAALLTVTSSVVRLERIGQLVLLVLIGCGIGVAVNLLVFPPLRYRSAEQGVRTVAQSLCDLVGDVRCALREEDALTADVTGRWRQRAANLGPTVERARGAVRTAQESVYYNPRRLLPWHREHNHFQGYASVLDALERVSHQLASLIRTLDQWHDGDGDASHRAFLRHYGDCLDSVGAVLRLLAQLDETRLDTQVRALRVYLNEGDEHREALSRSVEREGLNLSASGQPYGVLMVEMVRLLDEFHHTREVLQQRLPDRAP